MLRDHQRVWDGKDQAGRPVPPEAYHYVVIAKGRNGEQVEHDLTDLTGGEAVAASDVQWNPETGFLRYRLSKPARVNIRIGLQDNGPLLRTLVDWVPREGGVQLESWDGMDASDVLDLSHHPRLEVSVDAFALSANTVFVGKGARQVELIQDMPWGRERRPRKRTPKKRMYSHSQQPMEQRGDFRVYLTLPQAPARNDAGVPLVDNIVPVRLDVAPADRERVMARRFETVFFVDGVFVFENELGFLPTTWRWDTRKSNEGEHYLTVNLRGYEGNFGMATIKVIVKRGKQ